MSDGSTGTAPLIDLPTRSPKGHKGSFGTVVVAGGSAGEPMMLGGPCLAGRGAFRAGCGRVVLAVPRALQAAALGVLPEATAVALEGAPANVERQNPHALAIGPGLGSEGGNDALVAWACGEALAPRVFDADALGAMARLGIDGIRGPVVLTPHPGEWITLARAFGVEGNPIDRSTRPAAAQALAARLDDGGGAVVVVLKGAETVVSDGTNGWRSSVSEPLLAVGGSGDVLSGVIASLLAQFHPRPGEEARSDRRGVFDLACAAVHLHAMAGVRLAERLGHAGLLARELADELPFVRR